MADITSTNVEPGRKVQALSPLPPGEGQGEGATGAKKIFSGEK